MEDRIKKHFEEEAVEYDGIIIKLIPYYKEMVQAIIATIPFKQDERIDIMDLGCGTGTITQAIQQKYTQAHYSLVDVAENMLFVARTKLGENHNYINSDFNNLEFDKQYDVIVSSLALHHLETPTDKQLFYSKIYKALKKGGIFINADVVLAQTEKHQQVFIREWISYMNRSVDMEEIEKKWLPNYYAEDNPISLMNHLEMLKKSGFMCVDVIWKYYGFCVYMASKSESKTR